MPARSRTPFIALRTEGTLLRAELDAYYAKLYGLTHDELRYILDPKDVYGPDPSTEPATSTGSVRGLSVSKGRLSLARRSAY